ncbi:hypothetical protein TNCV_1327481 [Trichonephila clavipes]|nr:hypothetical protein TNCV_1327481 [Trichonephila clavipes]
MPDLIARVAMNFVLQLHKHFLGQPDHHFSLNRACLGYDERRLHRLGNVDDLARQLEQIWQEIHHGVLSRCAAALYQTIGGSTAY